MDRKLVVLSILLVTSLVASTHNKEFHRKSHKVTNRQHIFQQSRANQVPPIGNEVQNQLRQQVNSDSREVGISPTNADAINGLTGPGIGLPFGTPSRRIDRNPLIGANGLTKSSLANIMFGNLKGLVKLNEGGNEIASYNGLQSDSIQGGDMRQMVGGQMGGMNNGGDMGNIFSNTQPMNLNALAALNNLAASQGLNAFGTRNGALSNMVNGGNMNDGNMNMNAGNMNAGTINGGSLAALGLSSVNPSYFGNPGTTTNSFGGPIQPNPTLGLQMMSQLSNMNQKQDEKQGKHHKRHHKHKKHHKKSTTKLLLRLLVDKLKDIYELDQMAASNRKLDSSTVGKIGLTLDDLGVPKGEVHRGHENKSDSSLSGFKTKLSFPVTISDSKATEELHLTDEANRENFEGNIPTDDDDSKIQKILSGLGIKEGVKTEKKMNGSQDSNGSILKDNQTASELDAKAKAITSSLTPEIKGQEVKTENAKSRDNIEKSVENELKMEEKGSLSEFHTVKMSNDLADVASISKAKSEVSPSEMLNIIEPQNGEVTAPQISSISSLLNNGIDQKYSSFSTDHGVETAIPDKSLQILEIDNPKKTVSPDLSNEKVLSYVPSDINTDQADLKSLTDTMAHDVKMKIKDGEDYVKAARVLGAVFLKVKDPVAKNSIETAIKAMMQVMKNTANENNSSKKHQLPSDDDEKLVEQIQQLNEVFHQMKRNLLPKNSEKRSLLEKKDKNNKRTLFSVIRRKMLNKLIKSH